MQKNKIELKIKNYIKLKKILELKRSVSLIQINNLQKRISYIMYGLDNHLDIITLHSRKFSNLGKFYISKNEVLNIPNKIAGNYSKKLFVYFTDSQKYTENYYKNTDNFIIENHNESNLYIPVGVDAQKFFEKTSFNILSSYQNLDDIKHKSELANKIIELIKSDQLEEVIFVVNSNKFQNFNIKVFPLTSNLFAKKYNQNNLNKIDTTDFVLDKFDMESLIFSYLISFINFAILESSFLKWKNKLIDENSKIKQIDEKQLLMKIALRKQIQNDQIEEINLISEGNKKETNYE
ncbi:hypothetical protein EI74_0822 [Mycoplasma testudineum]|uniref:F-type H+-transporting ATPase subunit gamma n=1 Tax=Mycoplasma testudineum TaxID=244584 RepID=A0A4R6I9Y3_9MOLU|nr:hypothetical protein [Mycoplasma testudineum]OYD26516.1 hypothetical protein CG473_03685 [Mycoplasma testudineum]TDO19003.1 hypothetical protein EI74_0822 [Mycoplasma testudineum]